MSKRSLTNVKSKYFSIDSYFKNAEKNKKIKTSNVNEQFEQQLEEAIKLSMATEEQCPICQNMIQTEIVSLEVHVNQCLDTKATNKEENKDEEEVETYAEVKGSTNKEEEEEVQDEDDEFSFSMNDDDDDDILEGVLSFEQNMEKEKENQEPELSFSSLKEKFSFTSTDTDFVSTPSSSSLTPTITLAAKSKKKQKPCPFYKRVRDTRFTVDAFSYGDIPDCDGYFLSHYHSDHYGGLRSNWKEGPIYCSKITANLVKQELRVDSRYIHPLPMNELYPMPNSNVTVALIDANHCPGSVLFLFIVERTDGTKVRHLHTGDFRASPRMCLHPFLRQPENQSINCLYLDTTYLSPQYAFPAQEECINAVCEAVERDLKSFHHQEKEKPSIFDRWLKPKKADLQSDGNLVTKNALSLLRTGPRVLIAVGTYTIGKERVFINIARRLKCKVYAPAKKRRILLCQEDEELKGMLTNNPSEAQVHVVPLRDIRADIMLKYLEDHKSHFDKLIAFKPTGWTFKSSKSQTSEMKLGPLSHITLPPSDRSLHLSPFYKHDKIKLYGVPYSEHSSFRELASFIASLDIQKIIPTVNISQVASMNVYFDNWEQEKRSKRIEVIPYPNEDYW